MTKPPPISSHEIRILMHLHDAAHPMFLQQLREAFSTDMQEMSFRCLVIQLRDRGMVTFREIGGDDLVTLTPQGVEDLATILAAPTS